MILIEILVGLPGSGKTYFASHRKGEVGHDVRTVECDNYMPFKDPGFTIQQSHLIDRIRMEECIRERVRGYQHWVLDGLFLTHEDQSYVVWDLYNILLKQPGRCTRGEAVTVRFIYFKENREVCLFNDATRPKERRASATIKQAKLEKPDLENFRSKYERFTFEMEEREVHKMTQYEIVFKPHEYSYEEDIMRSETWSRGGTWANCWGNEGSISADPEPKEFKEFEELVNGICPDISHRDFKTLVEETVTVEEGREYDYYGGCEYYAYFKCDLKKLYEKMIEMKLIERK